MYTTLTRYEDVFFRRANAEVAKAQQKFPEADANMTALTEEVGELAKALMDKPWDEVEKEAIQVAAMACRVAMEGDPTLLHIRRKRYANRYDKEDEQ